MGGKAAIRLSGVRRRVNRDRPGVDDKIRQGVEEGSQLLMWVSGWI
jgi:hypothetical protein